NFEVIARAPELFHTPLHVRIETLARRQGTLGAENDLCGFGGELATRIRGPSLHDHRPALDCAGDVEGPAHRQVFAAVVHHVHSIEIEMRAAPSAGTARVAGSPLR